MLDDHVPLTRVPHRGAHDGVCSGLSLHQDPVSPSHLQAGAGVTALRGEHWAQLADAGVPVCNPATAGVEAESVSAQPPALD